MFSLPIIYELLIVSKIFKEILRTFSEFTYLMQTLNHQLTNYAHKKIAMKFMA